MGKDKDTSLFKDLMENVWNPRHIHKYNYKYLDYLEGSEYCYI